MVSGLAARISSSCLGCGPEFLGIRQTVVLHRAVGTGLPTNSGELVSWQRGRGPLYVCEQHPSSHTYNQDPEMPFHHLHHNHPFIERHKNSVELALTPIGIIPVLIFPTAS